MAVKLEFGEFRTAGGGRVLCRFDITIDGWLTVKGASLFHDQADTVCLGMPTREFTDREGKKGYADTVKLTQGARDGMLRRAFEAYLESPICQRKEEPKPAPSEAERDPFE